MAILIGKNQGLNFYNGSSAPPSEDTKLPQNTPQGKVITIEQVVNQSPDEVLRRAFDGLPPSRVIIALRYHVRHGAKLAKVIARIRGRQSLVIEYNDAEENKCMEWLRNGSNDLIIAERLLSGFEWPSIVWIGGKGFNQPFQDLIMRAVSTLVIVGLKEDDYKK